MTENAIVEPTLLNTPFRDVQASYGASYLEFRKELSPRYVRLWVTILSQFLALFLGAVAFFGLQQLGSGSTLVLVFTTLGCAVWFGFFFASLNLYLHEAAHFGLHPNKKQNDLFGNLLFAIWVGTSVEKYRRAHWSHHQHLGTPIDPEHSYFSHLTPLFLFNSLFLWKVTVKVFYRLALKPPGKVTNLSQKISSFYKLVFYPMLGVVAHASIILSLLWLTHCSMALAWVIGIGFIFPFIGALRQLLEHRSLNARKNENYFVVHHGAVSRIFGDDLFTRMLGNAGFNKHLLHHWDSGISCTRLKDIEGFLLKSNKATLVREQTTTYFRVFMELIRSE